MTLTEAYANKQRAMKVMQSCGIAYKYASRETKEEKAASLKRAQQGYSRACKEYNKIRNAVNANVCNDGE